MLAKKALSSTAAAPKLFVEDVFSCFLYTGNASTQTINNGIDLSGEGGLVWIKNRTNAITHGLYDTERGATYWLASNTSDEQVAQPTQLTAFNNNGFSLGASSTVNGSSANYASWTFRKAEKFFDVVTYTGDGTNNRQINHNLQSVPGCMIFKSTDSTENWFVYHRGVTSPNADWWKNYGVLNLTSAFVNDTTGPNQPTSTYISVNSNYFNSSGKQYVVYLFAHDAGGFGDSGSQSVIKCGSYTGNGSTSGPTVDLGWEPQYLLVKRTDSAGTEWTILDNMRGIVTDGIDPRVWANLSSAENTGDNLFRLLATGFQPESLSASINASSGTYIYIAIRRGPMKTPEAGTEVFAPLLANTSAPTFRGSFPIDAIFDLQRLGGTHYVVDRLRGSTKLLATTSTAIEASNTNYTLDYQTSAFKYVSDPTYEVGEAFRRAPGFFDVVCYTGNRASGAGTTQSVTHNLGVAPELLIVKGRSNADGWIVYSSTLGNASQLALTSTAAAFTAANPNGVWNETTPTATQFTVGANNNVNRLSSTYVAYLFATCAGVSKVGSYTGTGTTLQINCGFTGGARFVLIKRTDSTGDWYVWDTARGIVSGNDPYLLLNSTAAEVTNTDYIDTYSSGFEISSAAPAAINANGGTFIYLAIA